jgi:hypothetical protein
VTIFTLVLAGARLDPGRQTTEFTGDLRLKGLSELYPALVFSPGWRVDNQCDRD